MPTYPNDSDGDALRRVATNGSDMSAPMEIDFPVLFTSEAKARAFAPVAIGLGYRVEIDAHENDSNWDVMCSRRMVPNYDELIRIQDELNRAAMPFDGKSDGWGTFGNNDAD